MLSVFSELKKWISLALSAPKETYDFYSPQQEVVDLTSLLKVEYNILAQSFSGEFQTPYSQKILAILSETKDPRWQNQRLYRSSLKASYDDLQQIRQVLNKNQIPYVKIVRQNPIRVKSTYSFVMAKAGLPAMGHVHRDLIRHRMTQNRSKV